MVASTITAERQSRRLLYERLWVVGVVGFTLARFVVAYSTLRQYHLNIWLFGFIDIATAVPYGVGTARLAMSLADRSFMKATQWLVVAGFSFLAPYAYIAIAGESMPTVVYLVIALLVIGLGTNATLGVRKKVASMREGR